MDRIATISGNSAALNAAGLANNITYAGGGFALTADTPGDTLGHIITILGNAATNHSGKTFTVSGLDANGESITEGIAGPNGNVTVSTTKYFADDITVTVDSTTGADSFDIGWTAASVSAWVYPHPSGPDFTIGFACVVDSGTPTYGVQHTYDNGTTVFNHVTVTSETTSQQGTYTAPIQGYRLNWTAAGQVTMWPYTYSGVKK